MQVVQRVAAQEQRRRADRFRRRERPFSRLAALLAFALFGFEAERALLGQFVEAGVEILAGLLDEAPTELFDHRRRLKRSCVRANLLLEACDLPIYLRVARMRGERDLARSGRGRRAAGGPMAGVRRDRQEDDQDETSQSTHFNRYLIR